MKWIKWLAIFLLIPCSLMGEITGVSGSFSISGATATHDSYGSDANTTTNYGAIYRMYIGEVVGSEKRSFLQFGAVKDSMGSNICDSATIRVVVYNAATTTENWVFLYALRRYIDEATMTWDNAVGGGEPVAWTTAGAGSSTEDYYPMKLDSFYEADYGAGDTIYLNVKPVFDSGWYTSLRNIGFKFQHVEVTNNDFMTLYTSDTNSVNYPVLYVEWSESDIITQTSYCSNSALSIPTGTAFYDVTEGKMKSFSGKLDSLAVRMSGIDNDTLIPLCYRNFSNDSSLVEAGTKLVVTTGASCETIMLQFSKTSTITGDSSYFFGVQLRPNVADAYAFCASHNSIDSGYGGASYSDSIGGSLLTLNSVCFTAYLTEVSDAGARVIIIGSCLEEEYIYEGDQVFRRVSDGYYRRITDLVFGG